MPSGQSSVLRLSLAGELNAHSYTTLVASARAHYQQGWRALLLDMSQTTAIELSGFLALLNIALLYNGKAMLDPDEGWAAIREPLRSTAAEVGNQVKLLAPSPAAALALARVPFCASLERYADLESALIAFAAFEKGGTSMS
jgi:hypothetical protein